jgi:hypothetical protein
MRNLATRAKPDGGAMTSVVERFVTSAMTVAKEREVPVEAIIQERLAYLNEWVGGYDFAQVVAAYWRGYDSGDDVLKNNAVRWFRGEFATKTEAKQTLGVRTIVDDTNVYDQLKLMAQFVRLAGYSGLLVGLDELVNLYKLSNAQARASNYEQILCILNDTLQGTASGLGFLLGGTPEFLSDRRRGLHSYPALQTRLGENSFAVDGLVDLSGPVLKLENLTPEDLFILLTKIRHVIAQGEPKNYLLQDRDIQAFMAHCSQRIGEAYFRTPRNTITAFVNLLAVLEQNPGTQLNSLIAKTEIVWDPESGFPQQGQSAFTTAQSPVAMSEENDLASFQL